MTLKGCSVSTLGSVLPSPQSSEPGWAHLLPHSFLLFELSQLVVPPIVQLSKFSDFCFFSHPHSPLSHLFLFISTLDYFLHPFPYQPQDHCLSLRHLILRCSPDTVARGVFLMLVLVMSHLCVTGLLIPLFRMESNDLHNMAPTYCNLLSPAPIL